MSTIFEETAMRIDLFAHFTTQEFRQAYLSIPLGTKGPREYFLESRRRCVDEAQIDNAARQTIYEGNASQLLHLA
jgi:hypothetical protein